MSAFPKKRALRIRGMYDDKRDSNPPFPPTLEPVDHEPVSNDLCPALVGTGIATAVWRMVAPIRRYQQHRTVAVVKVQVRGHDVLAARWSKGIDY